MPDSLRNVRTRLARQIRRPVEELNREHARNLVDMVQQSYSCKGISVHLLSTDRDLEEGRVALEVRREETSQDHQRLLKKIAEMCKLADKICRR